jgi:DNA polymerase elongation subunit (family B)
MVTQHERGQLPSEWLDAQWVKGDGYTIIQWADANKKMHWDDSPVDPYFFVEADMKDDSLDRRVNRMDGEIIRDGFISPRRKELVKINLPFPSYVRSLRNSLETLGFQTYESEIPFIRRLTWDLEINQCPLKDKCAFDIEVDAVKGFPDVMEADKRIISVSVVGSDKKEYFFSEHDEKEIFSQFHTLMRQKYHMMTGWNIRDFDIPYWRNRAKKIGFRIPFTPIQEIDAMLNYQKAENWGFMGLSYKLSDVADRELGMSKISFRTKSKMDELMRSFNGDKRILKEYNMNDARLVLKLDEKLRLSELYISLARFVKLLLRDAVWVSACAEALLMRKYMVMNPRMVFPRRQFTESGELPGGYVMDPVRGLHEFVYHYDFTSLYNRIIRTYALSPEIYPWFEDEWFEKHGEYPKNLCLNDYTEFVHRKMLEGSLAAPVLPQILTDLEVLRKTYQAKRDEVQNKESMEYILYQIGQTALKLIILGCWGIIGRKNTRFYNLGLAKQITLGGQDILLETIGLIEGLGFKVTYADTDGVFFKVMDPNLMDCFKMVLNVPDLTKTINDQLKQRMIAKYNLKPEDYSLFLGGRYVMPRCLFLSKKRYIGQCVWEEGKFGKSNKVAGLEMRRSDAFDLLKESQRKIMEIILDAPVSQIERLISAYLETIKRDLFAGKSDDKLMIMTGTKKKLSQYTANGPQRKLIQQLEDAGAYRPGDDVTWFIIGTTPGGNMDVKAVIPGTTDKVQIRTSGYEKYWQRITKFPEKVLGTKEERELEKVSKLEQWI